MARLRTLAALLLDGLEQINLLTLTLLRHQGVLEPIPADDLNAFDLSCLLH